MERIETDVLIAGGGIAGLTAAAAFAAAGFAVVCVDPVPPAGAGRGGGLGSALHRVPDAGGRGCCARAGLWERLAPHAAALRVMRIADAGGREPRIRDTVDFAAGEIGDEVFGYNLPNWLLRREMVARLAGLPGARLLAPARVERVTPRSGEALVRLADGAPGAGAAGGGRRRARQRAARGARHRGPPLGLRAEGAGLHRHP